jgi:hypothetical protein
MRKTLSAAVLSALWMATCAAAQAPAPPKDALFTEIGDIASRLADISGLRPLAKIDYGRISREQVRQLLEQRIRESVKPREILAEEAALKKLGFAPADFDLKKTTIELLSEQAAAFYDFHKKKLFVIDSGSGEDQHIALVHEIAHALADQHFHLEKFIRRAGKDDDSELAREAVMEGQATWLMSEYGARQSGRSLIKSPLLAKLMSNMNETAGGQFPVFDRAPLYLRETLLFPYVKGMLFQQAIVEKMDKAAFAEVFRRPPENTQQVLHPEKYLARVKAVRPAFPAFASRRSYRLFTGGELGELDHQILLRQYADEKEAAAIAPEWRGGRFRLFELKGRRTHTAAPDWRRMVLAYSSRWSGVEPARRVFDLYQKVLAGKWENFLVTSRSADQVAGQGDDGYFLLRREGDRVTSLEGLPAPEPLP